MNFYAAFVILALTADVLAAAIMMRKKTSRKVQQVQIGDFSETLERLRQSINDFLDTDYSDVRLKKDEADKSRRQQTKLRVCIRQACLGDTGSAEYLKEHIKETLQHKLGIGERNICSIISFNDSRYMSAAELFEYMYMIFKRKYGVHVFRHMEEELKMIHCRDDYNCGFCVSEGDIRRAYSECEYRGNYADMLETLTQRCFEKLYGHDSADLLISDSDIDGVSGGVGGRTRYEYNYLEELLNPRPEDKDVCNSYDVIYCVYKGKLIRMKFLGFGSEQTLERVVKNLYRYNSRYTLSKRNPVLQATLKNNSRVVVARPPVSDSWAFYVRKFTSSDAKKIESLITDRNSDKVIALLKSIVESESNFVISGNTGGGKTTLLKSLIGYINPQYALRVIESSFELNINNLYPTRNVHAMQERGDFTIYDAITASKKMDTDVLILGEVNEPKVAGAFIQVAQSGSRMAITTLHHETTGKLIEYLRNALVSEFGISDVRVAEKQVVDSIQFDVHMVHDVSGHHFIERIT